MYTRINEVVHLAVDSDASEPVTSRATLHVLYDMGAGGSIAAAGEVDFTTYNGVHIDDTFLSPGRYCLELGNLVVFTGPGNVIFHRAGDMAEVPRTPFEALPELPPDEDVLEQQFRRWAVSLGLIHGDEQLPVGGDESTDYMDDDEQFPLDLDSLLEDEDTPQEVKDAVEKVLDYTEPEELEEGDDQDAEDDSEAAES